MTNFSNKVSNFFKNIFKPKNWKRWFLFAFTGIGIIIAVVLGTIFGLRKGTINKSVDYVGGITYQVEVNKNDPKNPGSSERVTGKELSNAADALKYRFSSVNDLTTTFRPKGDGIIEITKPGDVDLDSEKQKEFEEAIKKKPTLVFTDINLKPLFIDGEFNQREDDINYSEIQRYIVPLKENSAKPVFDAIKQRYFVELELEKAAVSEWTKATASISRKGQQGQSVLFVWLNIDELVEIAKIQYKDEWEKSGKNAANFTFVNNTPWDEKLGKQNAVKKHAFDGEKYLVSFIGVQGPMNSEKIYLQRYNWTKTNADALASNINFGSNKNIEMKITNTKKLDSESKTIYDYKLMWISIFVVIAIIALMFLVCFGILGALNLIPMSLYFFLTLYLFKLLGGEFSPASFLGLVFGLILAALVPVLHLNEFKNKIYSGEEKTKKAYSLANKKALPKLFDMTAIALFLSVIFFFIGNQNMKSFSIILTLSLVSTMFSMIFINWFFLKLIINTDVFDEKLGLVGISKRRLNASEKSEIKTKKFNFVHLSKFLLVIPIICIVVGIVTYGSLSGVAQNGWAGFNKIGLYKEDVENINIAIDIKEIAIILSVSLIIITLYSLVRFGWTSIIPSLLSVIQNVLMLFAVFVLTRIPFTEITVLLFLFVILMTAILNNCLFSSIKQKMNLYDRSSSISKENIRKLANSIYYETFKEIAYLASMLFVGFIVPILFITAADMWAFGLGIISMLLVIYGSYFTSISLWSKLEERNQALIQKRIDTKYWIFPNVHEEQIFLGINSYNP